MEVVFTKTFLKDLSKIQPLKRRKQIEILVFEKIPLIKSIEEIGIAEKLTGYDEFYKIRVGEYRIGISKSESGIQFIRVLNRKEIYKYFP